jgi:hypothetical protein
MVCFLACALAAQASVAETVADYNSAGVQAYNAGNWPEAVVQFEAAYELERNNEVVRKNLCNAYHAYAIELAQAKDFLAAAELLNAAISVQPENPVPLIQLGACYLRMARPDYAIFRLEEAVDLDPDNVAAHDLLGQAYYDDNDLPSALARWDYVLQLEPNRPGVAEKYNEAYRYATVESDHVELESRHFRLSYGPGTSGGDITAVLTALETAYLELGNRLGGLYPPTPVQVILYTTEDFAQATLLGEHVGAVYDGKIRLPIRDKTGKSLNTKELRRRIRHEYTHVLVRCWAGDEVPWWLNEGLAETLSRGDLTARQVEFLRYAGIDALFPIGTLEEEQLLKLGREELELAYLESHAVVSYLWRQSGFARLRILMDALAQNVEPEQAVVGAYQCDYGSLLKRVVANLGHTPTR